MWIKTFFLPKRQLQAVTRCPLYTYRCIDQEYEELRAQLQHATHSGVFGKKNTGALFCLFAAEWWRRNYQGGTWRWEPLLAEINLHCTLPERYELVELGLRFWQRPLIRLGGTRRFLVTLACEGGLPLQLLHQEKNKLHRYFKEILRQKQLFQSISCEQLATELQEYLPRSLRQDMVFELSEQLINTILDLQALLKENTQKPLQELDRIEPNWRNRIPLNLDDELAEHLLNDLVCDAVSGRQHLVTHLSLKRYLIKQDNNDWQIRAEIIIPNSISTQELSEITNQYLPERFELSLSLPNKQQVILAYATKRGGEQYLLESSKRIHHFSGIQATREFSLILKKGLTVFAHANLKGGEALTELPWIFIDKKGSQDHLELIGSGSAQLRYEIAWVVHAKTGLVDFSNYPEEPIAHLNEINRTLYCLEGVGDFMTETSDICVIKTSQTQDTACQLYLSGKTLDYSFLKEPIYIGLPCLYLYSEKICQKAISINQIYWKVINTKEWRPINQYCLGQGQLAWFENNELKFLAKIAILPANFQVTIEQFNSHNAGKLILNGISNAEIGWNSLLDQEQGIERNQEKNGSNIFIHCKATRQAPIYLIFVLRWQQNQQLNLNLPFPIKKSYFIDGEDTILEAHSLVSIEKLSGIRAIIMNPTGSYKLDAQLKSPKIPPELKDILWFKIDIPKTSKNYHEFAIAELKLYFSSLLSAVDDLDAYVDIRIEGIQGTSICIHICHYDLSLHIEDNTVSISKDSAKIESLQTLTAHLQPLWKPDVEPKLLSLAEGIWHIDASSLETGSWLITVRDGQWLRGRPWIFPVTSNLVYTTELGQLQQAVCLPDTKQRKLDLAKLLTDLAVNPNHPDWDFILNYFKNFSEFPASSIDVFKAVSKNHEVAVLLLLKTSDSVQFSITWNLLKQLPFSWLLIPLDIWDKVIYDYIKNLKSALVTMSEDMQKSCIESTLQTFFNSIKNHHSADNIIKEWIHREYYDFFKKEKKYLSLARQPLGQSAFKSQLDQAQQELLRNHADDEWPSTRFLQKWKAERLATLPVNALEIFLKADLLHRQSVQDAPIITALSCAFALPVDAIILYEIRHLRLFDPDWFDEAYCLALTLAAGIRLNEGI